MQSRVISKKTRNYLIHFLICGLCEHVPEKEHTLKEDLAFDLFHVTCKLNMATSAI